MSNDDPSKAITNYVQLKFVIDVRFDVFTKLTKLVL